MALPHTRAPRKEKMKNWKNRMSGGWRNTNRIKQVEDTKDILNQLQVGVMCENESPVAKTSKAPTLHWQENLHYLHLWGLHASVQKSSASPTSSNPEKCKCADLLIKSLRCTHIHLRVSTSNVQKSQLFRNRPTRPSTTAITRHWPATKSGRWLVKPLWREKQKN